MTLTKHCKILAPRFKDLRMMNDFLITALHYNIEHAYTEEGDTCNKIIPFSFFHANDTQRSFSSYSSNYDVDVGNCHQFVLDIGL